MEGVVTQIATPEAQAMCLRQCFGTRNKQNKQKPQKKWLFSSISRSSEDAPSSLPAKATRAGISELAHSSISLEMLQFTHQVISFCLYLAF